MLLTALAYGARAYAILNGAGTDNTLETQFRLPFLCSKSRGVSDSYTKPHTLFLRSSGFLLSASRWPDRSGRTSSSASSRGSS
jgi:hypothetical protein